MKSKIILLAVILMFARCTAPTGETQITADSYYLNFPISESAEKIRMNIMVGDSLVTCCNIRLTDETPDYWMFYDISEYTGKEIRILVDQPTSALKYIAQSNEIKGEDQIYSEHFRPQYHFSTKRGWINDPNGLIYYDGEYHLFYQYNPFDIEWGNLNWGHAVSRDLIHWEELPIALKQDEDGMVFSGSAIIDENNVTGLGIDGKPVMLAFYTEEMSDGQTQFMAYSNDKGRTWTKWPENPILDNKMKDGTWHNRDPKVFWYEDGKHWVMIVHEKDGHSIYTSDNLLDWTFQSHTAGFWECPELFELPVDGNPKNMKWVMTGASGTYMVGSFDGKRFMPETGKHYYISGYQYAAQTYNGIQDGRRIQVGWSSIRKPGMPFTGHMQLPLEMRLKTTKEGIRLLATPIAETEQLFTSVLKANSLSMDEANEMLHDLVDMPDGFRVKLRIRLSHPTEAALVLDGQKILHYDMNFNRVNGTFYSPQDFTSMELSADLYIDRSSVEGFIDGGYYAYVIERKEEEGPSGLSFWTNMETIDIEELEVFTAKSIWK